MVGSNHPSCIDMLIIGSGPVGLTAAIEAARMGLSYRIIERKSKRHTNDSRALLLHPRLVELLEVHPTFISGLNDRATKIPCISIELIEAKTTITIGMEKQRFGDTEYPGLNSLPQYQTEECLEHVLNASGGKVEYGVAFEGLTQTAAGDGEVSVKVSTLASTGEKEEITAKYVVGADGGRSKVRESVGISLERISSSVYFVVGDIKLTDDSPNTKLPGVSVMLTKDGPVAMFPLPDNNIRLVMQAPPNTTAKNTTLDKEYLEKQLLEMTGKEFKVEIGEWMTIFEITHGVSNSYRKDHVFLVGDAAHIHSPVGGQGMNYGMWDAVSLLSKIAWAERVHNEHPDATEAIEEILASYVSERHSMGQKLVSGVKIATWVATTTNRYLQTFRNFMMRNLVSYVEKDIMRTVGQLDLAYKPSYSQFILPVPTSSWLFKSKDYICHPGQRLPNLIIENGSRLYKQVDRVRYTYICVNLTNPPATADNCIHIAPQKEQISIPAISGETLASPQTILVRPDLYVAAVELGHDSFEKLEAAVKNVFGAECYAAM